MLARAPVDGHQMNSNWIIAHAYRHRRRSVAYRHRRSLVVRLQALEKLSLPFQKPCHAESHARVPAVRKQQFIRQLPLQHDALDRHRLDDTTSKATTSTHPLAKRQRRSQPSHQRTSQPPPLAQSSPAAQSSTEQPVTRPLTTQDVPSIVQAVLDTVYTQSTSVAVLGSTEAVPTVIPPAPSPVQADTNETLNETARVATTAVVPSSPTTEVVPNLAPSKLPALI